MQSLSRQFLDFCRSKPADETFDFDSLADDETGCAITQFVHSLGMTTGGDPGYAIFQNLHSRFGLTLIGNTGFGERQSFHALADRLEQALS